MKKFDSSAWHRGVGTALIVFASAVPAVAQDAAAPTASQTAASGQTAAQAAATAAGQQAAAGDQAAQGDETAAQTQPRLVLSFKTGLRHDDNYNLSTTAPVAATYWDNTVGLRFHTGTAIDSLTLTAEGTGRLSSQSSATGAGLVDPAATLDYTRQLANGRMSVTGSYARNRVTNTTALVSQANGITTVSPLVLNGRVATSRVGATVETGVNDPVGFILSADAYNRTYSGTNDPNAYNARTRAATATVRFRPDAVTRVDVAAEYGTEHNNNVPLDTRRRQTGLGITVDRTVSPILGVTATLGYRRIRSDMNAGPSPIFSRGLYGSVGVTRETPNGNASVTLESQRDPMGIRNTLRLGRTIDIRGDRRLEANIGVADRPGAGPQAVGRISYLTRLPGASFSAILERDIVLNADNVDVAYTHAGIVYSHAINAVAAVGMTLDWSKAGGAGFGAYTASDRRSINVFYSRTVTANWNLTAGVEVVRQGNIGQPKATSNAVYLSLARDFNILS